MFGHKKDRVESPPIVGGVCSLLEIPHGHKFRIAEINGGAGLHRRLLALGFHRGDLVALDGEALLGGPVLVKNLNSDTRIALGRSIARKILVEPADEHER
ncbi:MAG: ferrous iron transport protein A [Candidatus Saccharicenans sp.]|nr:ferrous iron transport protein A [Candidatus Saccharicenans sp.]